MCVCVCVCVHVCVCQEGGAALPPITGQERSGQELLLCYCYYYYDDDDDDHDDDDGLHTNKRCTKYKTQGS